jgi:hypothetical protein
MREPCLPEVRRWEQPSTGDQKSPERTRGSPREAVRPQVMSISEHLWKKPAKNVFCGSLEF